MNIFAVRHGQSKGNLDANAYRDLQDHMVTLTNQGLIQPETAGKAIRDFALANNLDKFRIYYSPFLRTRQTQEVLAEALGGDLIEAAYEDERLREQDFGLLRQFPNEQDRLEKFPAEYDAFKRCKEGPFGAVYARPPMGESRLDVLQRVRQFVEMVMREHAEEGVENMIVVSHGITIRALEMALLRHTTEWFETSPNPDNCQVNHLSGTRPGQWTTSCLHKGFTL